MAEFVFKWLLRNEETGRILSDILSEGFFLNIFYNLNTF